MGKFLEFVGRQEEGVRRYKEKKFEKEKLRHERRAELEEVKAKVRTAEAKSRPRGAPAGEGFGRRFVRAQQSFFPAPSHQRTARRVKSVRRASAPIYVDQYGKPIRVTKRVARRKRRTQQRQQYDPFAPTFRL